MKILLINTSDINGGAAIAAYRLMEALRKEDVEVRMLVKDKFSDNDNVTSVNSSWLKRKINLLRFVWERLIIWLNNGFSKTNLFAVSIANTGNDISKMAEVQNADIIHLHWYNQGFLSLANLEKLLRLGKPVVLTLHDMWNVTGICHYSWTCKKFENQCDACPFLVTTKTNDLSAKIFEKKKDLFAKYSENIHLVSVSSWLGAQCRRSRILSPLPVSVIFNVIDIEKFKPGNRTIARKKLGIPHRKRVILMGADKINAPIKGFGFLKDALTRLNCKDDLLLVLFGNIKDDASFFEILDFPHLHLGRVNANDLPAIYQAADVTVTPSLYEAFGQTVSESLACGTPVAAFNNSGPLDIIDHKENGYLAKFEDPEDLAAGINWILNHLNYKNLSEKAREKVVLHFNETVISKQYIELYRSLMNNDNV